MQGLFRNPLVEPGLLGVSGGAALFAVLGIVFGASLLGGAFASLGNYLIPVLSFIGGLLVTFFAYALSRVGSRPSTVLLILAGVAVNALTGALIGLVIYQASDAQIRDFTFWSLGSLGGITWQKVGISSLMILLPGYFMVRQYKALNALALGESEAFHLGVHVEKTRITVIALSAVMVGGAVAFTGIIGFIGLIVPHLVRLVLGADHRVVLPASLLAGAILLTGADTLARMVVQPAELPIGIVTALLGSPFFIWLLISKRKQIIF
jgi:iron complex transport system permease protein